MFSVELSRMNNKTSPRRDGFYFCTQEIGRVYSLHWQCHILRINENWRVRIEMSTKNPGERLKTSKVRIKAAQHFDLTGEQRERLLLEEKKNKTKHNIPPTFIVLRFLSKLFGRITDAISDSDGRSGFFFFVFLFWIASSTTRGLRLNTDEVKST